MTAIPTGHRLRAATLLAGTVLVLLAALAWFTLPWPQTRRADLLLADANGHIESANRSLAEIDIDLLSPEGFTSLEEIDKAREAVAAAGPRLEESTAEVDKAEAAAEKGSGLLRLPDWYADYLRKKQEVAKLRGRQLRLLEDAAGKLEELYQAAPLMFQAMEEMDRLLGRFESAMDTTQDDPVGAAAALDEVSRSMRAIQQRLEDLYARSGFILLQHMADNVRSNAELAEQSKLLADAVAGGDQSLVQQTASDLENHLMETDIGIDYLQLWLDTEIKPLKSEYEVLRSRQQQLDQEAAELFHEHR